MSEIQSGQKVQLLERSALNRVIANWWFKFEKGGQWGVFMIVSFHSIRAKIN